MQSILLLFPFLQSAHAQARSEFMKRVILLGLLFVVIQSDRQLHAEGQWVLLDKKFAHYHDSDLEKIRTTIVNLDAEKIIAQNRQFGTSATLILNELNRQVTQYSIAMRADKDGYVAQHGAGPDVDAVFVLIDSDAPDQIPSLAVNPWLKAYIRDRWLLISTQAMIRVVNGQSKNLEGQLKTPPPSAPGSAN